MAKSVMGCMFVSASTCLHLVGLSAGAAVQVPGDFATIQQAIDATDSGDTILVGPGTYQENLLVEGKALTLVSVAGAASTIVQGADDQKPVVDLFLTGAGLMNIDGFTLTGGMGGIRMFLADAVIENCDIRENANGSGVDLFWGTVVIENCSISSNGGSNVQGGGIFADFSHLHMHGTSIADNRGFRGGGLRLVETVVVIGDCAFAGNEAEEGGAMYASLATASIANTVFSKNIALNGGGAINLADVFGTTMGFHGCNVQGNRAALGGGILVGQGVKMVNVGDSSFCDNQDEHVTGDWNDQGGNLFADSCRVGDLNSDGSVDDLDLKVLLAAWGSCPLSGGCLADLNGDAVVDVSDLLILLANWG